MPDAKKNSWIREQQMIASLDMVSSLCSRQCRAIAAACLRLRKDPIYEDVLGRDAARISMLATTLLGEKPKVQGHRVLQLAIARKLLLQALDRKEVVVWLARDHPETLSVLLASTDFDELGCSPVDDEYLPITANQGKSRIARHR